MSELRSFNLIMAVKLGVIIPINKQKKIKIPERILDICKEKNIEVSALNVDDDDFFETGPFDVLLHKIEDFYNEYSPEEALKRTQKVREYAARYPNMIILDNFEVSKQITDRTFMTNVIQSCCMTVDGITVFVPKIIEIPENATLEKSNQLVSSYSMKFPVLAKPLSASMDQGSHDMVLIFSREHLCDLPIPCLLQEFCNHSGIIYKVFVIGDHISYCERPSIKDINQSDQPEATLYFDTREVSKTGKAFIPELHGSDPNERVWLSSDENPDMLNINVVNAVVKKVKEICNIHLFGLDILIEKETGNYALIDCNQFPGYTGINENYFPKYLVELVLKLANK